MSDPNPTEPFFLIVTDHDRDGRSLSTDRASLPPHQLTLRFTPRWYGCSDAINRAI